MFRNEFVFDRTKLSSRLSAALDINQEINASLNWIYLHGKKFHSMKYKQHLFFVSLFILLFLRNSHAQDSLFAHRIIDTLTSKTFLGRGYTHDGNNKAARYIANMFFENKLESYQGGYYQPFAFDLNSFSGLMQFSIDGKMLDAGKDYIISGESKGLKGKYRLVKIESIASKNSLGDWSYHSVSKKDLLVIDDSTLVGGGVKSLLKIIEEKKCFGAAGYIELNSVKLTMDVSETASPFFHLIVLKKSFPVTKSEAVINIQNKIIHVMTQNIIGYVKGKRMPDSFIVLTAHYDHLGEMGNSVYFPGANDNASGTSMLLTLCRYYAQKQNQPDYTIVFIAFSGEEAGLIGSQFFAQYPLINLNKIKFLINMDIVGTGEEGIKVVNATEFPNQFSLLQNLNDENHLLKSVQSRGKAANSDHYPFYLKGVPDFFIYTLGGISAYHDVYDRAETLPLTKFNDLEILLKKFIDGLQ